MALVITALACLVGFTILGLYASLAVSVYHFRRDHAGPGEALLPMTLIKPVRGLDDGMRENFEAITDADPENTLQVIIALEGDTDPAAAVARGFAASHPERDILVLYTGPARGRMGRFTT
jgi:cellulose synthase/poly-beta-1,6-N-acetylglucosamine synthase-like glycosyltransferase